MKKNEIELFAGKWVELEITTLSKVVQVQKDKNLMFSLIWKLVLKINVYLNTYITTHIYAHNIFVIMGLFEGLWRWSRERE
jgi:hypothetical protein